MNRSFLSSLLALLFSTLMLAAAATPAMAAPYYHGRPTAEAATERFVAQDVLWRCGDAGCTAARSNARAPIVCSALVKKVGRLESFAVAGAPVDPAALEKCNARAK